jgi:hypothetical protein
VFFCVLLWPVFLCSSVFFCGLLFCVLLCFSVACILLCFCGLCSSVAVFSVFFRGLCSSVARLWPAALLTALTVLMTWPQALLFGTHAADHHDVYFNMWRLGWIAHALSSQPTSLFDGNIFYPERHALTFSDAMPIEGLVAAPLLWTGVRPVLVHNLLLFGAIISSALALFVLVRRLTGSAAAAVVAAIIFAFAPYRFEHYHHMELQWTAWMPLTFWAMHRTLESGRWLHGLQAGAFVALQMLSSVYYGIFLATVVTLAAGLFLVTVRGSHPRRAARALAAGGALAVVVCSVYGIPYLTTKNQVGGRPNHEIVRYSARASDYLYATPNNTLYGKGEADRSLSERRLFPGALAVLLAVVGLLLRSPGRPALIYLVALGTAFEMSLGLRGYSYRFLYEHLALFEGLRVPARLGIFVVMFLAVLAGYGYSVLHMAIPAAARRILPILVSCILLLEYRVEPLQLVRYDNSAPPIYRLVASEPRGIVAEFPMPLPQQLPGPDAFYAYMSTFHWNPLINGYSGFFPLSYLHRLEQLREFPDARSIETLRQTGVTYVIVHLSFYEPETLGELLSTIDRQRSLRLIGRLKDSNGQAILYRLD